MRPAIGVALLLSLWGNSTSAKDRRPVGADEHARHALIIGNADYRAGPLDSPKRDASDLARKLRELGFDVVLEMNLNRREFQRVVDDYTARLGPGDVSFFFYSGHGMQEDGENFLIPVDFDPGDPALHAYALGRLIDQVADRNPSASVVVVDACRDSPFRTSKGAARGLASVHELPPETLVAFATGPGQTASDGAPGRDAIFTESLLRLLDSDADVELESLFRHLRADVATRTANEQIPWSSSNLVGSFCLRGDCRAGNVAPSAPRSVGPEVDASAPRVKKGMVAAVVGTLIITTKPRELVRLEIMDPEGKQTTSGSPLEIRNAKPGDWKIVAQAPGCEEQRKMVTVPPDDIALVRFDLKALEPAPSAASSGESPSRPPAPLPAKKSDGADERIRVGIIGDPSDPTPASAAGASPKP